MRQMFVGMWTRREMRQMWFVMLESKADNDDECCLVCMYKDYDDDDENENNDDYESVGDGILQMGWRLSFRRVGEKSNQEV